MNAKKIKKVGNREVIFNETFILPFNEEIKFPLEVESIPIQKIFYITLIFKEEVEKGDEAVSWNAIGDDLTITIYGVTKANTQGHRIAQFPARVGKIDGKPLTFLLSFTRHLDALLAHIQFMVEL